MRCAKCGSENGPSNKFCLQCGAPLDAICPSCGHTVAPGVRFCQNCGQRMGAASPAAPVYQAPASATLVPPVAPQPAPAVEAARPSPAYPPPPDVAPAYAPPPPVAPRAYTLPPPPPPAYTPPPAGPVARAYPPPPPPALPVAPAVQYKGVWPRFFATLIDAILLGIPILYLLGSYVIGPTLEGDKFGVPMRFVPFIIIVVAYLVYAIVLEAGGGTLGKRLLGMRVVNGTGGKPGYGRSVARNLLRLIDLLPVFYILGILMVARTGKKQRLGDKLAGTYVVRRQRAR